jgi:isoleucyl-tRNA synthetase
MASIARFYADRLYTDLTKVVAGEKFDSVHLAEFPVADDSLIDKNLEECMRLAQQSSSMILALRRKANKKVRQPLAKAVMPAPDEKTLRQLSYISDLIKTEVNVKELEIVSADSSAVKLVKRIKPNFKTLGKKYGKQMKAIAAAVNGFSQDEISSIEKNGQITLNLPDGDAVIELADVEIITEDMPGWLVANEGNLTIALDIEISEELKQEGIARELVNRIQNLRKSSGFEITDKITVQIEKNVETDEAVKNFGDYISNQVLASSISIEDKVEDATDFDFEDFIVKVKIAKK